MAESGQTLDRPRRKIALFMKAFRLMLERFGPGSLRVIVVRVATVILTFLMTLVISRSLGVQDTGVFFLVYSVLNVAAAFGRFGTDNLALRVSADARTDLLRDIRSMILIVLSASALAFVVLGLTLTTILDGGSVAQHFPGLGWIVASSVFPLSLSVLCGSTLRGNGRVAAGTFAELGTIPAVVSILQSTLWVLHLANLDSALMLLAGASWVALAWSFPYMLSAVRSRPQDPVARVERGTYITRNFLRLSSMMGSALLIYAITWAPVLVLGVVASEKEVAFFTVAQRVAVIVTFISTVQVSYMAPRIASFYTHGEIFELNRYLREGVRLATAVVVAPAIAFIVFPQLTMELLFGAAFAPGADVLMLLVVGSLLTVAGGQIPSLMILCDMERALFVLNAAAAVAWLTLGVWLSSVEGALGAAIATLGITIITTATGAILLQRRKRIVSYLSWKGASR
jgi:O-antigen/teichoic acid export membrane protein